MNLVRIFKNFFQKFIFLIHLKNSNLTKFTVLCYNVAPVLLKKKFNLKSYIFSNHGIAFEIFDGLIRNSKNNIIFINENNFFLQFLPKSWDYIYHFSNSTYKYILKKNSFSLLVSGNTYKTNNEQIFKKIKSQHLAVKSSFRIMQKQEDLCCKKADKIISISSDKVFKNFKDQYKNKEIFQLKNSTYLNSKKITKKRLRNEVVMIAGRGSFHKGVDIYFDLAKLYPQITFNLIHPLDFEHPKPPTNLIVHGFLLPSNKLFTEICSRSKISCFFSISEGFPGSVCDSVAHNLLPLVPKDLGLKFDNMFEYVSFDDMIKKFGLLYFNQNIYKTSSSLLNNWKERNISIEVFRSDVNRFTIKF